MGRAVVQLDDEVGVLGRVEGLDELDNVGVMKLGHHGDLALEDGLVLLGEGVRRVEGCEGRRGEEEGGEGEGRKSDGRDMGGEEGTYRGEDFLADALDGDLAASGLLDGLGGG